MDFKVFPNNTVTDDGDLVHFALLANAKPVSHEEVLKHDLWRVSMLEEMRTIKKSQT